MKLVQFPRSRFRSTLRLIIASVWPPVYLLFPSALVAVEPLVARRDVVDDRLEPLEPIDTRHEDVEHDEMGSCEIFLVPVGPDSVGMVYEAIFT